MAVGVNVNELGEGGGGDFKKETEVIPAGFTLCRLVSYIEMGHHKPVFGGKPQVYEAGKRSGQEKDAEMIIHLIFEFPLAKYTGDFPLTIKTSIPYGKGEFMNKLSVVKSLEEGWVDRKTALKMNFVKALMAMQDATKTTYPNISNYVDNGFGCTVTHKLGKKADENGDIPRYANMKLESLVAPESKDPMTGEVKVYDVPEAIGEYCSVFEWDNPTMEAWVKVPKYLKTCIMTAVDYKGSKLEMMLAEYGEDTAGDTGEDHKAESTPPDNTGKPAVPDDDLPV